MSTDEDFPVNELEILVDPIVLADHSRRLTEIMGSYYHRMTITPSNQHIVILDDDRNTGIAVRFFQTGSPDYAEHFVPPYDSNLRGAEHVGRVPTYRNQLLPYDPQDTIYVPILRFDLLLRQRLLRFDQYSRDQDIIWQNERDIDDIRTSLRCAVFYGDPPFSAADVNVLLPIVRRWIRYAKDLSVTITVEEVEYWRRLHIILTGEDVAGLFFSLAAF